MPLNCRGSQGNTHSPQHAFLEMQGGVRLWHAELLAPAVKNKRILLYEGDANTLPHAFLRCCIKAAKVDHVLSLDSAGKYALWQLKIRPATPTSFEVELFEVDLKQRGPVYKLLPWVSVDALAYHVHLSQPVPPKEYFAKLGKLGPSGAQPALDAADPGHFERFCLTVLEPAEFEDCMAALARIGLSVNALCYTPSSIYAADMQALGMIMLPMGDSEVACREARLLSAIGKCWPIGARSAPKEKFKRDIAQACAFLLRLAGHVSGSNAEEAHMAKLCPDAILAAVKKGGPTQRRLVHLCKSVSFMPMIWSDVPSSVLANHTAMHAELASDPSAVYFSPPPTVTGASTSTAATQITMPENYGEDHMGVCDGCGDRAPKGQLKVCTECKCGRFCSKECFKRGWQDHKKQYHKKKNQQAQ